MVRQPAELTPFQPPAFTADQDSNTTSKQRKEVIMIIKIIITHLALLSSLQSSPGFINIHGKIHAENENNENINYFPQKIKEVVLLKVKNIYSDCGEMSPSTNSIFIYFPVCVTYPWTSDSSAWCLLRGGGGCALGIRSIVVTPKDQVVFKNAVTKKT